jgi:hypothetical protein
MPTIAKLTAMISEATAGLFFWRRSKDSERGGDSGATLEAPTAGRPRLVVSSEQRKNRSRRETL